MHVRVILSLHDISTTNRAPWRCRSTSDLSKEGQLAAFAGRGLFPCSLPASSLAPSNAADAADAADATGGETSSLQGSAQLFGGFASPKRVACRMLAVSAHARDQRLYLEERDP